MVAKSFSPYEVTCPFDVDNLECGRLFINKTQCLFPGRLWSSKAASGRLIVSSWAAVLVNENLEMEAGLS